MDPPTAEATRLILPARTSLTANTPVAGRLRVPRSMQANVRCQVVVGKIRPVLINRSVEGEASGAILCLVSPVITKDVTDVSEFRRRLSCCSSTERA